jgi:archaeal flagellin FlaB
MKTKKDRGMMGVGTLIIFIAMILVAAVAAAVLISTSSSLQQRSLLVGSQSEEGISTGAEAVAVTASNASGDHQVEDFEMLLRLQAGSSPMNFDNTVLLVDSTEHAWSMDYSGGSSHSVSSSTGAFGIEYVKQGPDYENGYLSRGDVVKMTFNVTSSVPENKRVRLKIVPRVGVATLVEFTTPDVMTDQRVSLWP